MTPVTFPQTAWPGGAVALRACIDARALPSGPQTLAIAWRCLHDGPSMRAARHHEHPTISLVLSGACRVSIGGLDITGDPTQATLFSAGVPYRTSHPYVALDRGVNLSLLGDLAAPMRNLLAAYPGPTGARQLPISPTDLLEFTRLARGEPGDGLRLEEAVIALLDRFLGATRPSLCPSQHRLAERARELLCERFREEWSLADLGAQLGSSAGHLSRVFKARFGLPVWESVLRLRLAAVLDRLTADPRADLATVAVDHGFYSHSHLTSTFTRRFGRPPDQLRRDLA